ncbi:MAG TPA: hypothetical protein VIG68_00355, partial [Lysobacter sp.]
MGERFGSAQDVVRRIARHQGLVVVLTHPNITGHKLEFSERLVDAWKAQAWIGPLREFGQWWAARDALDFDIERAGDAWVATAHSESGVHDLVVQLPKAGTRTLRLDLAPGADSRTVLAP